MKGLCYFAFYGSRRLLAILAPVSKVGDAPLRFLVAVHALCLTDLQHAAMNFPSVVSILAPLLYWFCGNWALRPDTSQLTQVKSCQDFSLRVVEHTSVNTGATTLEP